jgi:hypothetical protein
MRKVVQLTATIEAHRDSYSTIKHARTYSENIEKSAFVTLSEFLVME